MKSCVIAAAGAASMIVLGLAAPAQAQTTYPPETLSTQVVACGEGEIVVSVDGAKPDSNVHVVIDFANVPDIEDDQVSNPTGFFTGTYPLPTTADTGLVFTITITGLDFDPNNADGTPFQSVLPVNREECPDLPSTGADSLPIGKMALGTSLVGAFLVVVALRRRPRETAPAAA